MQIRGILSTRDFAAGTGGFEGVFIVKKKVRLCGMLSLLLSAVLLLAGCGGSGSQIRFGAAGLGGVYQSFASAYTQLAGEELSDLTFEVKTTAGSAANLRLLSQEYIQLAIAQADLAADAYSGTGSFSDSAYQGYSAVAGLYTELCQIVVRADSGLTGTADLIGKKVSIGEAESGTEQNALQILEASGLSTELVTTVNLNYTDAASQLASGEIDAFFCTAGIQTTVIEELAQQCEISLLPVSQDCVTRLAALNDAYTACTIPAGTYTGVEEDVSTVGVRALLLVSDKLSEETVKELTALLFDEQAQLQYALSIDFQLTAEEAAEDVPLPFHPGAAAYYAENGITVETEAGK